MAAHPIESPDWFEHLILVLGEEGGLDCRGPAPSLAAQTSGNAQRGDFTATTVISPNLIARGMCAGRALISARALRA